MSQSVPLSFPDALVWDAEGVSGSATPIGAAVVGPETPSDERFYTALGRVVLPAIEATLTDRCAGCGRASWPGYGCGCG